jgi:hypothetical protein
MSEVGVLESETTTLDKSPLNRLNEAIKDPNLNADQKLDVFEKEFIEKIDTFKPNDYDVNTALFDMLPKQIISDPNFSGEITDLPNANDPRLDLFPIDIRKHLELDDKGERGHSQFRKFPEDPRWSRYWELVQKYTEKIFEIVEKNPDLLGDYYGGTDIRMDNFRTVWSINMGNNYTWMLNEVREKAVGGDLIASGEWLGSGTFLSNIEKMLEYGGKMKSAYHVINSGQEREDIKGDIKGGDAHRAFIFFYHWRNQDYKYHTDVVGRYGTLENNLEVYSDVGMFYPVDTIIDSGLTIGSYLGDSSMSEYFATKSPEMIKRGARLSPEEISEIASKDQTELPLNQAFFRVDQADKYESLKLLFLKFGYEENWIKDHVFYEEPKFGREKIREWLRTRPYKRVNMPKYKAHKYFEDNFLWEPSQ